MFFGVGLIAHAVIFSRSKVKRLGITGEIYSGIIMLGYLTGIILGRRSGPWAPIQMSIIEASGEVRNGTYLFLFVSALDRLLFSMRPYWGQEQEPLHVTFVEQQQRHPWRALWLLLSGHSKTIMEQDGYHSHNASVLELLMDDDYIIDGEFHQATSQDGPLRISTAGPHGFTEALYAYTSGTANNGSAFAGLSANTPFYNTTLAMAMMVGRFFMIVPMLAIAGSLAAKKIVPPSRGTFPTHGPLFVCLLVGVVLIVGGLTFLPALALGPVTEHLAMMAGQSF